MNLIFNLASLSDAPDICKLVNSAYRGDLSRKGWTTEADYLDGQRTDYDEVIAMIEKPGSSILLARENNELVACCELQIPLKFEPLKIESFKVEPLKIKKEQEEKFLYFGMFSVKPDLQNKGIGKIFLEKVESLARQWGCVKIKMCVITLRKELISYYERRGYLVSDEYIPFPTEIKFGIPKVENLKMVFLSKSL